MMELSLDQIKILLNDKHTNSWFLETIKNKLSFNINDFSDIEALPKSKFDDLYDAVFDTLLNDTEVRSTYRANQDKGEYLVTVRGLSNVWFVQAPEYDDAGFFKNPVEADEYISLNFGEFLLEKTDKETLDEVDRELKALDEETFESLANYIKNNIPENVSQELWETLQRTTKDLSMREKIMNYQFVAYKIDERIEQKNGDI